MLKSGESVIIQCTHLQISLIVSVWYVKSYDCFTGTAPRPVIILGPFAQALIQKLVHESHDKYMANEGELLNTENTVVEQGIADGVFVDYKKVNDLFEVTRTQKLHEIANSVSIMFDSVYYGQSWWELFCFVPIVHD